MVEAFIQKNLIALAALGLATVSLGWNIYKELILKAKVRVSLHVTSVVTLGGRTAENIVMFKVTNFGPGQVQVTGLSARNRWADRILRKTSRGFHLVPAWDHPFNTKLPGKLAVGEMANVVIPYEKECFLGDKFRFVGVLDSFGRVHRASKKDLRAARKQYRIDFPDTK